jgi:hypothetical protein
MTCTHHPVTHIALRPGNSDGTADRDTLLHEMMHADQQGKLSGTPASRGVTRSCACIT